MEFIRECALDEPGCFVRCICVYCAAQVHAVVRDDANRATLNANQRGHHREPEERPQLKHRVRVGHVDDELAHVVDTQPVLRDRVAKDALISGLPLRLTSLWKRRLFFCSTFPVFVPSRSWQMFGF